MIAPDHLAVLFFPVISGSLDAVGKVAVFLVMLSVLIVLHEAGHFVMARRSGVRVNDFAVGFGPTLLKWTSPRTGTNYRLNLLPIGGYCAMHGEDTGKSEAEQQREFRAGACDAENFQAKPAWQRLTIIVAGPLSNFILAYLIVFIAAITFGIATSTIVPEIGILMPNSPAVRAGFHTGDRIVAIDGKPYTSGDAVVARIHASSGQRLRITIARGDTLRTLAVTPTPTQVGRRRIGHIGFLAMSAFKRVGVAQAIPLAGLEFKNILVDQIGGYVALLTHFRKNAGQLSGVIGMERAASTVQDLGWGPYLDLAATISIALGLINLLPLPALDGGRAAFIVAELLRGRPVEPEREAIVHVAGLAVLMVAMVFLALHDIGNIVSGKGVL